MLAKQDDNKELVNEKERQKKTKTNEEHKENNLDKDSISNKKALKGKTEEPDEDEDGAPVKAKSVDAPDEDETSPFRPPIDLQGSNSLFSKYIQNNRTDKYFIKLLTRLISVTIRETTGPMVTTSCIQQKSSLKRFFRPRN